MACSASFSATPSSSPRAATNASMRFRSRWQWRPVRPLGRTPGRVRRPTMSEQWEYQLRIDLDDERAALARRDLMDPAIKPLRDVLSRHHATMKCQYDAFADYVAEAEKQGT